MAGATEIFGSREIDYVVVDETHHSIAETYRSTIEYFRPKFLLGLTAMPDRGDGQSIEDIYGPPLFLITIEEDITKKLLCNVDYSLITDEIQNLESIGTPNGFISISELNRTLFIPKRDEEIVRLIRLKLIESNKREQSFSLRAFSTPSNSPR